ncbi:MAG: hypothetical protein J0L92_33575, partial [Deltaproteobacteria bacterium]|nr:hypothetical protein [Deltaproteobacteria bacterium]
MQREPRQRVREDESEHDVTGEEPEGLAFELARAIEEADARRVISQLETHVKTREGVAFRDDGVELGDVEAASAAGGYRESATQPLHRALGPR